MGGLPAFGHRNEVMASHADGGNVMDSVAASHVDGGNREMNSGASGHGGVSGRTGAGGGVGVVGDNIVTASRGTGGINGGGNINSRSASSKRVSADDIEGWYWSTQTRRRCIVQRQGSSSIQGEFEVDVDIAIHLARDTATATVTRTTVIKTVVVFIRTVAQGYPRCR